LRDLGRGRRPWGSFSQNFRGGNAAWGTSPKGTAEKKKRGVLLPKDNILDGRRDVFPNGGGGVVKSKVGAGSKKKKKHLRSQWNAALRQIAFF